MKTNLIAPNKFIWWEKSVEYSFIADMVKRDMFRWAAPLSGTQETALADTVANWDGKLLLIEFKRDISCLKSEREKYTVKTDVDSINEAYITARAILLQYKGFIGHGLIYGKEENNILILRATPYWDNEKSVPYLEWCAKNGIELNEFEEYLIILSGLRGATSNNSNGSSGSRSFVIGVGKDNSGFSLELEDYINLRPVLKLEMDKNLKLLQVDELNVKLQAAKKNKYKRSTL